MQRLPKWDTQLLPAFIAMRKTKPFMWGANDCCTMAADAIQAITGVDIAGDFRGQYLDEKSAFKLIKKLTGGTTVADAAEYCAVRHGMTEYKYPLQAKRGDLVVLEDAGRLIAGFVYVDGRHIAAVGEDGFRYYLITEAKRAWAV